MLSIYVLFPLVLFIISSYMLNIQKIRDIKRNIIILSVVEGIFSYIIAYIIYLEGFISSFFYFFIFILLILVIGLILVLKENEIDRNWWLLTETTINNLVLFGVTILPLYVFLTIFRFISPFIQIPLAIILTLGILILKRITTKRCSDFLKRMGDLLLLSGIEKFVYLWIAIVIFIMGIYMIDLPTDNVSQFLNLHHNDSYILYDGLPTDITNNFNATDKIVVDSKFSLESDITDYYYNDTHLYLYTAKGLLLVIDINNNQVVYQVKIGTSMLVSKESIHYAETNNKFLYYNNKLLLFSETGIYSITPTGASKISHLTNIDSRVFYIDDSLYFLDKVSEKIFKIYVYNNDEITLFNTIDVSVSEYDNVLVISGNLFYEKDNRYVLYENPSISFEVEPGYLIFDEDKLVMYYLQSKYVTFLNQTGYIKIDSDGKKESFDLPYEHNLKVLVTDNLLYFTEGELEDSLNQIEIMNNDFEFYAIFNHQKLYRFWVSNQFDKSYIANYRENNNNLEFLQVDKSANHLVLSIKQLSESKVDVMFPFYAHYSIGIFIPMFIAFIIPLTNYRKSETDYNF